MEETPRPGHTTKKWLLLLLKLTVTVVCILYVSGKIDFEKAGAALKKANWLLLLLALLLLAFSKLLSSYRLNIYFRSIAIPLPEWNNIKLYWLGMFYNLFLPGSISGDAYKIVLLKKKYTNSYKKTSAAVLLDRFSGLLALGLIMSVYGVIVFDILLYDILFIAGAIGALGGFYALLRFYFKDFLAGFWPTLLWGLGVQLSQVLCVYCIMLSLHLPLQQSAWVFIFLAAAVITVLPISLGGGLGTREFVFVEGALFFSLNADIAVVISLLFYLCTLLSSLPGLYFVFNDPLQQKITQHKKSHPG